MNFVFIDIIYEFNFYENTFSVHVKIILRNIIVEQSFGHQTKFLSGILADNQVLKQQSIKVSQHNRVRQRLNQNIIDIIEINKVCSLTAFKKTSRFSSKKNFSIRFDYPKPFISREQNCLESQRFERTNTSVLHTLLLKPPKLLTSLYS